MGMLSLLGIRKGKPPPPPPPPPPPREKLIHFSTVRRVVRIVRWVAVGALVLDITLHGNADLVQQLPPVIAMVFTACALANCAPVCYGIAEDMMDQTPVRGRAPGHKVHTPLLNCGGASADWIAAGLTALATFFHGQCDALTRSDSTAMHALAAMFTIAALLVEAAVVSMYIMLSCIKSSSYIQSSTDLPTRDGLHTSGLVLF